MSTLVIRGGTVVDGTGAAGRVADVAVRDGRITEVGDVDVPASTPSIDAEGLVVAPGFVDIHTHYDAQLLWDPLASPSVDHGVTTVIGGNCGFTLAPLGVDDADYVARLMARVEGIPLAALEAGVDWSWGSFGEWLSRFEGRLGVNAGFLVGHSAIRRAVMGDDAHSPARPGDVDAMVAMLAEALADGGLGLSTSLSPTHNDGDGLPVPSRSATEDELFALARAVRPAPGTTLEMIPGSFQRRDGFSDEDIALMAGLSSTADRPLNWNLLGVSGRRPERHQGFLAGSDAAAARGGRVVALTLPDLQRMRLSFLTGFVLDALPGWDRLFRIPVAERIEVLRDPQWRERLHTSSISREAGVLRALARWERMEVEETFADSNAGLAGRLVGDIAAERGVEPFDAVLDIVIADGLRTGLVPPVEDDDETWRARADVWCDPRTVLGGSDAGAHLDMQCCAGYATALLGNGCRDRQLISLEQAVHQLSDVPARLYGLEGRGRIAPGWHADLVVFDPATVGSSPPRTVADLPGGAERLVSEAVGVAAVVVNGAAVVRDGRPTGDLPGQLLRSGADTCTITART